MIGIGRTTKGSIKAIAYASREEKGEQKAFATEISRNGIVGVSRRFGKNSTLRIFQTL